MSQLKLFELLQRQQTLLMATVNSVGVPTVSYAPFVYTDESFFIYTSRLSRHTQDLLEKAQLSIMLIEDEREADNPFARRRLTLDCGISIVARDANEWKHVMKHFGTRFGKVFGMISPLTDFVLFRLKPCSGTFVQGFGQAFAVDAGLLLTQHIKPLKKKSDK